MATDMALPARLPRATLQTSATSTATASLSRSRSLSRGDALGALLAQVIFCQHVLGVALFMLVANHAYVVALGRMPGLAPAAATANGKHHLPPHHANGNGLPK